MSLFNDMLDNAVSKGIDTAENKLLGEEDKNEKTSVGGTLLRVVVSIVWFIIALFIYILTFFSSSINLIGQIFQDSDLSTIGIIGLIISILFVLITFLVPYLRKKGSFTRWLGIIVCFDIVWCIYILATL